MSVSPGRTESKASVSKKRNIEKSLEKLTAVIFAAEWDQAARIIYHLKPCDIIVKYCIFLLARTQFLETLENKNDLEEPLKFLKTLGAFASRAKPIPWLNKTDRVNPQMFELACSSKGNPLDQTFLPVSAEAQKALFSSKICPFFSEAPPDFSFSYPARISHFGLLDPFDAFEKAYFASRRSSKKIALSELFLLDFLLTRAISEDLGNLGLGLLMRSNFKSFLSVCCEVTPSLPVDRERKKSSDTHEFTSTLLWSTAPKNSEIWEVKFSPNGRFLIAAERLGAVSLYSVPQLPNSVPIRTFSVNARKSILKEFSAEIACLGEFSPELTEIRPNVISFEPALLRRFNGISEVTSIVWSPDSAYFVCCSRGGFEVWKTENFELNPLHTSKKFTPIAVAWFPDSKTFLLADAEGIFLLSINSLTRSTPFLPLKQITNVIIYTPSDGNTIRTSSEPLKKPDFPTETDQNPLFSAENPQKNSKIHLQKSDFIATNDPKFIKTPKNAPKMSKIIIGTTDGRFYVSFAPFSRFFLFLHFPSETCHFWLSADGRILTLHTEPDIQRWDISQITPEFIFAALGFDKTSDFGSKNQNSPFYSVRKPFVPFSSFSKPSASSLSTVSQTRFNANEADAHGLFEKTSSALPWSPAIYSDSVVCRLEPLIDSADANGRDALFDRVCPCCPDSRRTAVLLGSAKNWANLLSVGQRARLAKIYSKEPGFGPGEWGKTRVRSGGSGGAEMIERLVGAGQRRVVVKSCGVGDTSLVFSGSEDGMVYGWTAGRETPSVALPGHMGVVNAVDAVITGKAYGVIEDNGKGGGKDGNRDRAKRREREALVASASDDGTVRLWSVSEIV